MPERNGIWKGTKKVNVESSSLLFLSNESFVVYNISHFILKSQRQQYLTAIIAPNANNATPETLEKRLFSIFLAITIFQASGRSFSKISICCRTHSFQPQFASSLLSFVSCKSKSWFNHLRFVASFLNDSTRSIFFLNGHWIPFDVC